MAVLRVKIPISSFQQQHVWPHHIPCNCVTISLDMVGSLVKSNWLWYCCEPSRAEGIHCSSSKRLSNIHLLFPAVSSLFYFSGMCSFAWISILQFQVERFFLTVTSPCSSIKKTDQRKPSCVLQAHRVKRSRERELDLHDEPALERVKRADVLEPELQRVKRQKRDAAEPELIRVKRHQFSERSDVALQRVIKIRIVSNMKRVIRNSNTEWFSFRLTIFKLSGQISIAEIGVQFLLDFEIYGNLDCPYSDKPVSKAWTPPRLRPPPQVSHKKGVAEAEGLEGLLKIIAKVFCLYKNKTYTQQKWKKTIVTTIFLDKSFVLKTNKKKEKP